MKKFLLATSAFVVIASAHAAHAADQSARPRLPTKTPPIVASAIYNWTGCYIGAHGGGGAVSDTGVGFAFFGNANLLHGGNGFAGGQIGCNYQNGVMVVGLEGEAWSGLTNHQHFTRGFSEDVYDRNRWSGDVAVRAGLAFDRALLYGKAGVAEGRFAFSRVDTFGGVANGATTLTGVLLAVGLEYGFAPNWSAKLEYDHIEYANRVVHINTNAILNGPINATEFASVNLIKAGINYRFGGLPFVPDSAPAHPAIYKALPSKISAPAAFSWTGCYAGLHGGGGWMSASNNGTFSNGAGGVAGGQLGCNLQAGAIVWGLEGEAAWSGLTDHNHTDSGGAFAEDTTHNRWSADVAARAGIAVDRALVYGKAGLAAGGFDFSTQTFSVTNGPDSQHGSGTLAGLLFGGGIEYAVTPNWSVKLEYDHVDYFGRNVSIADPFRGPFVHSEGATANVLKVGANYRFADVPLAPAVDRAGTGAAILKAPAYKAPVAASNWTGCYVGVHGGGGILADTNNISNSDALPTPESSGGFAGGQLGCDYQTGPIVWGVQGEAAWSRIVDHFFNSLSTVEVTSKLVWSADGAVRAGVAIDRGLFYGKTGVAVGGFDHIEKNSSLGSQLASTTLTGLLLAGGIEYALAPNWSVMLEYARIVFAGHNEHFHPTSGTSLTPFDASDSAIVTEVKAGINYRFGGAALPPISNRSQNLLPPPATDWTGCYAGVHAGGGVISDTFTSFDNGNFSTVDGGGAVAGGQAGCNYQAGMMVVGVEGDASWSNITNRFSHSAPSGFLGTPNFMGVASDRNRWTADIAARGGIAFDRALLFGKAGAAAGRFDFFNSDNAGDFLQGGTTLTGLLLGLGIEYAFAPNWSAKLEYNHVGYLARNVALGPVNTSESATTNIVKGGINYKFFGPSAVVVAKD
jgi:outer membrane immunogenic protein